MGKCKCPGCASSELHTGRAIQWVQCTLRRQGGQTFILKRFLPKKKIKLDINTSKCLKFKWATLSFGKMNSGGLALAQGCCTRDFTLIQNGKNWEVGKEAEQNSSQSSQSKVNGQPLLRALPRHDIVIACKRGLIDPTWINLPFLGTCHSTEKNSLMQHF